MKDNFLSITQAAKQKGVSRSALYQAIAAKRLKSTVIMGKSAIREKDLAAWSPKPGPAKGQPRSQEVRRRISMAQKRRWAERRAKDDH